MCTINSLSIVFSNDFLQYNLFCAQKTVMTLDVNFELNRSFLFNYPVVFTCISLSSLSECMKSQWRLLYRCNLWPSAPGELDRFLYWLFRLSVRKITDNFC